MSVLTHYIRFDPLCPFPPKNVLDLDIVHDSTIFFPKNVLDLKIFDDSTIFSPQDLLDFFRCLDDSFPKEVTGLRKVTGLF